MDKNQMKIIAGLLNMTIEADRFHLQVAKDLLKPESLTEQRKAELLALLAKRESRHEQQELLVNQMIGVLEA